jgi:hypothetical protein
MVKIVRLDDAAPLAGADNSCISNQSGWSPGRGGGLFLPVTEIGGCGEA